MHFLIVTSDNFFDDRQCARQLSRLLQDQQIDCSTIFFSEETEDFENKVLNELSSYPSIAIIAVGISALRLLRLIQNKNCCHHIAATTVCLQQFDDELLSLSTLDQLIVPDSMILDDDRWNLVMKFREIKLHCPIILPSVPTASLSNHQIKLSLSLPDDWPLDTPLVFVITPGDCIDDEIKLFTEEQAQVYAKNLGNFIQEYLPDRRVCLHTGPRTFQYNSDGSLRSQDTHDLAAIDPITQIIIQEFQNRSIPYFKTPNQKINEKNQLTPCSSAYNAMLQLAARNDKNYWIDSADSPKGFLRSMSHIHSGRHTVYKTQHASSRAHHSVDFLNAQGRFSVMQENGKLIVQEMAKSLPELKEFKLLSFIVETSIGTVRYGRFY